MAKKRAARKPKKPAEPKRRTGVAKHQQCPICYEGALNGVGRNYKTRGATAYYKCDRCGHNWSATVVHRQTVIEHREVRVDGQR